MALIIGVVSAIYTNGTLTPANAFPTFLIFIITFVLTFLMIELFDYTTTLYKTKKYEEFYDKFYDEGIDNYFSEYSQIDIKTNLELTNEIKMLEIYSGKNFTYNYDAFKRFLTNKANSLEVILLNPDQSSPQYMYLSNKFSYAPEKIKYESDEFIKELKKLKSELGEDSGEITVFYSHFIPQYSTIIFDKMAYVIFYKTSPGRKNQIPVFQVSQKATSTFHSFVMDDYNAIKGHSLTRKVDIDA